MKTILILRCPHFIPTFNKYNFKTLPLWWTSRWCGRNWGKMC